MPHAAANELGPLRNHWDRVGLLGQQAPERGVVPAQRMSVAVAMLTNALPQLLHFGHEFLPGHPVEVFIHRRLSLRSGETGVASSGPSARLPFFSFGFLFGPPARDDQEGVGVGLAQTTRIALAQSPSPETSAGSQSPAGRPVAPGPPG